MNFEIGESSTRLVMYELTKATSVRPFILDIGSSIWWQLAPMTGSQSHEHEGGMAMG